MWLNEELGAISNDSNEPIRIGVYSWNMKGYLLNE